MSLVKSGKGAYRWKTEIRKIRIEKKEVGDDKGTGCIDFW